jgi:hypothetical protein
MNGPIAGFLKVVLFVPLVLPIPWAIITAHRFGLPDSYKFEDGVHINMFPIIYAISSMVFGIFFMLLSFLLFMDELQTLTAIEFVMNAGLGVMGLASIYCAVFYYTYQLCWTETHVWEPSRSRIDKRHALGEISKRQHDDFFEKLILSFKGGARLRIQGGPIGKYIFLRQIEQYLPSKYEGLSHDFYDPELHPEILENNVSDI